MNVYLDSLHGDLASMDHRQLFQVCVELQAMYNLVQAMLIIHAANPPQPSAEPSDPAMLEQPSSKRMVWQLGHKNNMYVVMLSDDLYNALGRPHDVCFYFFDRAIMICSAPLQWIGQEQYYPVGIQSASAESPAWWVIRLHDPYMFNGYPTNTLLTSYPSDDANPQPGMILLPE